MEDNEAKNAAAHDHWWWRKTYSLVGKLFTKSISSQLWSSMCLAHEVVWSLYEQSVVLAGQRGKPCCWHRHLDDNAIRIRKGTQYAAIS